MSSKEKLPPMNDIETEVFIEEVKKRRPLWDFTVSHKLRSNEHKEKCWLEAVEAAELTRKLKKK